MHVERIAPWKITYSAHRAEPLRFRYVYGYRRACRIARELSTAGPRAEALVSRRAPRALRFAFGPIYKNGERDD